MTNLEQTFLESATRYFREAQSKEIDWEQRRYEIAKDILTAWCSNSDRGTGLGIPKNGAVGCQYHHEMLDNGNTGRRGEMLEIFREYLMQQYPDWNEQELVYSKWNF